MKIDFNGNTAGKNDCRNNNGQHLSIIDDDRFVGLDCLALPEKFSGAAYYVFNLAKNLLIIPREFSLAILCKPQHRPLFSPFLKSSDKLIEVSVKHRAGKLYFYEYHLKSILITEKVAVFYATHYICPPKSSHYYLITTFHDMGFLLFPQYYPFIKKVYFGRRMKTFAARADRIVTISQSTAAAVSQLFPGNASKISIIPSGGDHLLAENKTLGASETITQKSVFPYILAVNTFEIRKNFPFIIRVFNYLKAAYQIEHRLVLIGHPANGLKAVQKEIERSPFKTDIRIFHSLTVEDLVFYYRHCTFFINASLYEGFGFTPFEAIYFNRPVFLYRNNTIAEFLGAHPYIFGQLKEELWGNIIKREMEHGFPGKITAEAIRHLSWQNTANSVLKLIHQLLPAKEAELVL